MKRTRWLVLAVLVAGALSVWIVFGSAAFHAPDDHPVLGAGQWIGGFGVLDSEQPSWIIAMIDFRVDGDRVEGDLKGRFNTKVSGKLFGDTVRFSTTITNRKLACQGRRQGDFLLGECDFGGEAMLLRLHGAAPLGLEELASYSGLYEVAPGHRIVISVGEMPVAFDLATGWARGLFPDGEDRFFAGPTLAVPYPPATRLTFTRNARGEVDTLVLESGDGTRRAKRCCPYRTEDHFFESAGARLAGTLFLPEGEGPFPAAVWVHGSGRTTREQALHFPVFLVGEGFAVLAYDKRGTGASGGSYEMPDGSEFGVPFLRRRAGDVLAAVRSLRERPDVDPARVGLTGVSQAGWVLPMAAASKDVAFTVTLSGGATQLSLEAKHSRWTGETFGKSETVEDVIERLRRERPSDYDFRPDFAAQSGPGLWLYGYKDRSNPSQLCVDLLKEVRAAGNKDFTIEVFPDGNHSLLEARRGGYDENAVLDHFVPGLHGIVADWLAEKVGSGANGDVDR